uniref:SWIM-type domain-containing protein n=1 Tax=Ciona savignyi TaxID=51511 RepID=H2YXM3_CIOSA
SAQQRCCPPPLTEIAAKVAAANIPYQLVEERYNRVPEPVVLKLITWSFPRCEADIRRYTALAYATNELDGQDVTFRKGVTLAESGAIRQPVQIGFHLSGIVHDKSGEGSNNSPCNFNVAVTFDRCKVASSTCNCQFGDGIFFCRHVVALLIYRIRNPRKVKLRAPISDTLQKLTRDQLQKLTQYLLSRHANVLPTAQEIADCFSDANSSINAVHGAPDPTAGAGFQDENRWNLDDRHVIDHIRQLILDSAKQASANQLFNLISKVGKVCFVENCKRVAGRFAIMVTRYFVKDLTPIQWQHNDVCGKLWDQIGLLWICVVLNPRNDRDSKTKVLELLKSWSKDPQCPPEDSFSETITTNTSRDAAVPVKRNNGYGLVGHPLNPIHILFDTLTTAATNGDEESQKLLRKEAFEVCLLGVGEQRCMPSNARAQEKVLFCEKMLIEQLESLTLDDELIQVLRDVTTLLIEGGPGSGLGKRVHRESVPIHSFANYLFKALLPYDRKLVFRMGLQAMRMTVLDDMPPAEAAQEEQMPLVLPFTYPATWSVIGDLEARQYQLASTLLQTAIGEVMLLRLVVESVQRNMRNASHVFQLSHDAFKCATNQTGAVADSTMLNVALQLAMQVLRMTIQGGTWRRTEMVGWLVTCATEIGLCARMSVTLTWYTLFTPVEASTMVAGCVISPNTAMRLNLDPREREELYHNVCQMAMQCAVKDPQSCALRSLTLCETYTSAFDAVYHVITLPSSSPSPGMVRMRDLLIYLDQRGLNSQAFTVAHAATRRLRVPFNHDAHPAANDLLWTTQLAQSLGMTELEELVLVIVNKVRCASVLSDVLRTCTSSISGRMPNGTYGNRGLRADRVPLRPLLEASMAAYVNTIHSKLSHISPRHYTEFIGFLNKARETFLLAPDGHSQFGRLLANLKTIYKGKKKLLNLVASRFG